MRQLKSVPQGCRSYRPEYLSVCLAFVDTVSTVLTVVPSVETTEMSLLSVLTVKTDLFEGCCSDCDKTYATPIHNQVISCRT